MEVSFGRKFWVLQPTAWPSFLFVFLANFYRGPLFMLLVTRCNEIIAEGRKKLLTLFSKLISSIANRKTISIKISQSKDDIVQSISVSKLEEKEVK